MRVEELIEILNKCDPKEDVVIINNGDSLDDYTNAINCYQVSNSQDESINNVYIEAE